MRSTRAFCAAVVSWCGTGDRVAKSEAAAASLTGLPSLDELAAGRRRAPVRCSGWGSRGGVRRAERPSTSLARRAALRRINVIRARVLIARAAVWVSAATDLADADRRARPVRRSRAPGCASIGIGIGGAALVAHKLRALELQAGRPMKKSVARLRLQRQGSAEPAALLARLPVFTHDDPTLAPKPAWSSSARWTRRRSARREACINVSIGTTTFRRPTGLMPGGNDNALVL